MSARWIQSGARSGTAHVSAGNGNTLCGRRVGWPVSEASEYARQCKTCAKIASVPAASEDSAPVGATVVANKALTFGTMGGRIVVPAGTLGTVVQTFAPHNGRNVAFHGLTTQANCALVYDITRVPVSLTKRASEHDEHGNDTRPLTPSEARQLAARRARYAPAAGQHSARIHERHHSTGNPNQPGSIYRYDASCLACGWTASVHASGLPSEVSPFVRISRAASEHETSANSAPAASEDDSAPAAPVSLAKPVCLTKRQRPAPVTDAQLSALLAGDMWRDAQNDSARREAARLADIEATKREARQRDAVRDVVGIALGWDDALAPSFSCSEAEALAELLSAHGHDDGAAALLNAHAQGDEEGDAQYIDSELFTLGYARALLDYSTYTYGPDEDSEPETVNASDWATPAHGWELDAFTSAARDSIRTDCESFVESNGADLSSLLAHMADERDPHDVSEVTRELGALFSLTRNGHGVGYWDGNDAPDTRQRLTSAAKPYGTSNGTAPREDDGAGNLVSLD